MTCLGRMQVLHENTNLIQKIKIIKQDARVWKYGLFQGSVETSVGMSLRDRLQNSHFG